MFGCLIALAVIGLPTFAVLSGAVLMGAAICSGDFVEGDELNTDENEYDPTKRAAHLSLIVGPSIPCAEPMHYRYEKGIDHLGYLSCAMTEEQLEEKFNLDYHFKHVDTIFDRVFG